MLRKNKVNKKDITNIKQFISIFKEINDDYKVLNYCMEDIILKLSNMKTMTNINEKNISSEDTTSRVNYMIKGLKNLLCITKEKLCNIKIGYT
ncbi:hypothetical protein C1645_828009 [Glomus cerebriforme]|uniref:Uncharacterized protein n=1 Tax=Glomus cerebriforme TaxID=658196 RepID=A0A397SRL4_9GLOM|nr:hypothetical protein C1645_828009 [Glomus cerebriforme]